jgi:hypothetical protein
VFATKQKKAMSLPRQSEVRARRRAIPAVSAMALLSGVAQATVEYRPGTRIPSNARPYVVPRDAAIEVPAVCLCKIFDRRLRGSAGRSRHQRRRGGSGRINRPLNAMKWPLGGRRAGKVGSPNYF